MNRKNTFLLIGAGMILCNGAMAYFQKDLVLKLGAIPMFLTGIAFVIYALRLK